MLHNPRTKSGRRPPVFLKFGVKRAIYNLMTEHCRPTGTLDAVGRPFAAYDDDWNDQRVMLELRKSHPEVTHAHIVGLRQAEIGFLDSPLKTKISNKLAYMAAIDALTVRVEALEEWATSRKTMPFQLGGEEGTI